MPKNSNESVKTILHERFVQWHLDGNPRDWTLFVKANPVQSLALCEMIENSMDDSSPRMRLERPADGSGFDLCKAILAMYVDHDLISGFQATLTAYVKGLALTREQARKTAVESMKLLEVFLTEETRKGLASSVNTGVRMQVFEMDRIEKRFIRLADDEDAILQQLDSYVLGCGGIEVEELEKARNNIQRERSRCLGQLETAGASLQSSLSSLGLLQDLITRFGVESFDFFTPVDDEGKTFVGRNQSDQLRQQGISPESRAKISMSNAQARLSDAKAASTDQADRIEEFSDRVRALSEAIDPKKKAGFEYEEVEFEDLSED